MNIDTGTPKMIARKEGGIGWMTFNQPEKRNAVSFAMWQAIPKIMADFEADPAGTRHRPDRRGRQERLCRAPTSPNSRRSAAAEESVRIYNAASEAAKRELIAHASKPTISMIRGFCVGGGMAVALTTDMRICTDDSMFAVPAAKLGLGYRLSRA